MFSVPAVADDSVFVGSCAGVFYAFNKATGEIRWSYNIRKDGNQISFHGNPLVTEDLILIGTDRSCAPDGVGHVYAFERNTGKVRWKYQTISVPTDILRIGQNVYFGSFQDSWYALNLTDGQLRWKFSTGASNEGCEMIKAPVADDHHLFLVGIDGIIYSLDATSGRVIWKQKLPASPSTGLALKDKLLFVGASNNRMYRLDAETGTTVTELPVEAMPVGRITLTADALLLFLENRSERSGYLISISPELTKLRWQQKSSPDWASERPHAWNGLVVAGNCRGEAEAFRASDGAPQWKLNLKGCIRSIGSSEKRVFVGVQEGTVYAYELSLKQ
ncbi:MAG: PQQ-binding-like beta-propeller repeat protein [Pyrinomonadaceae bacterium]